VRSMWYAGGKRGTVRTARRTRQISKAFPASYAAGHRFSAAWILSIRSRNRAPDWPGGPLFSKSLTRSLNRRVSASPCASTAGRNPFQVCRTVSAVSFSTISTSLTRQEPERRWHRPVDLLRSGGRWRSLFLERRFSFRRQSNCIWIRATA
jgi:hypothetical protein